MKKFQKQTNVPMIRKLGEYIKMRISMHGELKNMNVDRHGFKQMVMSKKFIRHLIRIIKMTINALVV